MAGPDRALQLRILKHLSGLYPNYENRPSMAFPDVPDNDLLANLRYLHQHQLIDATWMETNSSGVHVGRAVLVARGVDFLADDGGLSAILGVVTIKLHDDTVRDLLIARVDASTIPPAEKSKIIEQIKALRGEALKTVTTEGLKYGLAHAPDAISWLRTMLGA